MSIARLLAVWLSASGLAFAASYAATLLLGRGFEKRLNHI